MHSRFKQRGWVQFIPALIGAASSLATNVFSARNASNQMDFQEKMSGTSYQRGVKDMQAAGLNPMLAYSQGGASTPMGSMPNVKDPVEGAVAATGATNQAAQAKANIDLTQAQAAELKSRTYEQSMNSAIKAAELRNMQMQTEQILADTGLSQARGMEARGNVDIQKFIKQLRELELSRDQETFSADVARRKAESLISQANVGEARARGKFYDTPLGEMSPALEKIMPILRAISIMFGGR